ncbi:MAG TPA: M23 family metallopeptidase, partial [Longimicrobiales bacterium]|nr:M23 family metallopeptidase [Longimicrobiales bacterium]
TWDGTSTGAGNAVLIHHSDGRSTSYLHLHTSQVQAGDRVEAGQVIGAVGRTGATYPHLHLGYMMDLPGNSVDERRSRNPLELLPHTPSTLPSASYPDSFTVELEVPLQSMTLRTLELHGGGERRVLDYYAVVALGSAPRNAETHGGIRVEAAPAHDGRFPLTLQVASPRFLVERVVAIDINGDTLMDSSRPE